MNSRSNKQHIEVMDRLSSIKYAMNHPSEDGIKALRKALQFVKKQYEPKSLSDSKTVPQIDMDYLDGFVGTLAFNATVFSSKMDDIGDPKKYVKQFEFGDPIKIIKDIMSAPRISTDELSDEEKDRWKKVLNARMNLSSISDLLDKVSSSKLKKIQISARVLALVTLVVGTILTNFILLIIAAGLISVDITIDKYMKESVQSEQNGGTLDRRQQPYFVSGVYPLIHINREKEYKDVTFSQNNAFAANNLIDLINKIHAYIDVLNITHKRSETDRFPLNHLDVMIRSMWDACSPSNVNTEWVRDIKDKILSISRMCCKENFAMAPVEQSQFLHVFLQKIEAICRELAGTKDGLTNDTACTDLVPMYETLFLQIWDAFLTHNHIKKSVPQVNLYVSGDMRDDTPTIIMNYNNFQHLEYGKNESRADAIISKIFESVGESAPGNLLTEDATAPDPGKIIDQRVAACTSNIQWHKGKRDGDKGIRGAVKQEIQNNASMMDRMKQITKETEACAQYSMNANNVGAALQLLNSIDAYLTTDYFKNRDSAPNNINELIMKSFPGAGITDPNKHMPGKQLANIIGSGSRADIPQKEMSGVELQKFCLSVVEYFANKNVSDYWNSDIFERLEKTLANFKINATNANRKPMTEGVDDSIFAAFEADQAAPPTGAPAPSTPAAAPAPTSQAASPTSPTQTPAPRTNVAGNADQKPVVPNQSATKDAAVISHAVDVIGNILNIVYLMTAQPNQIVMKLWHSIGVNMSNNSQQQPAQAAPQTGEAPPAQL